MLINELAARQERDDPTAGACRSLNVICGKISAMGEKVTRHGDIARRLVLATISALGAVATAVAGFHEVPNILQLGSMLVAAMLTALAAWNVSKKRPYLAMVVPFAR